MNKPSGLFPGILSMVLGIAVVIAGGLAMSACKPGGDAADTGTAEQVTERIKPFGEVAVEGQDAAEPAVAAEAAPEAAPAAAPAPAPAEAAPAAVAAAAPAAVDGAATYKSACALCHGPGIAGAPMVGDKANWSARIAQGTAKLHERAIKGYQGKAGVMPAKGGRMDLSDEAVAAAVDYMVAGSR